MRLVLYRICFRCLDIMSEDDECDKVPGDKVPGDKVPAPLSQM